MKYSILVLMGLPLVAAEHSQFFERQLSTTEKARISSALPDITAGNLGNQISKAAELDVLIARAELNIGLGEAFIALYDEKANRPTFPKLPDFLEVPNYLESLNKPLDPQEYNSLKLKKESLEAQIQREKNFLAFLTIIHEHMQEKINAFKRKNMPFAGIKFEFDPCHIQKSNYHRTW
jgi:hypothetical protein